MFNYDSAISDENNRLFANTHSKNWEEDPDCDFYGDEIMDDDCVIVINHHKYIGNGQFKWLTYDVLASNMNSFLSEVDEDEWADVEVMSGKEWRKIK